MDTGPLWMVFRQQSKLVVQLTRAFPTGALLEGRVRQYIP
jgi:hypothetical protein